jgi:hypothetical protein
MVAVEEDRGMVAVEDDGGMVAGGFIAVEVDGGVVDVIGAAGVVGVVAGAVDGVAAPGPALSLVPWLQAASANDEASSRLQHSRRIFMAVSFGEWVSAAGIRRG